MSPWSDTQKKQVIGRCWRSPQKKTVHSYQSIADKTQDVFLNNISFTKEAIHDAFVGSSPDTRESFWGDEV